MNATMTLAMAEQQAAEGEPGYRICTRCIMDTSDPGITFDAEGVCRYCHHHDRLTRTILVDAASRERRLEALVGEIKAAGRGHDYDCLIGVSGGVDSTYVAYLVKQLGLRPLAVHMDNGWNSNLAVTNIERALKRLDIDLITEVLDWEEFRDLQLAFWKASTPDLEIPTDHAITAVLMKTALQHGIKYIINGSNIATEGIMPTAWSQGIRDWKYIRSVHEQYGTVPLRSFPHFTLLDFVSFLTVRRRKIVNILNFVEYDKREAMEVIQRELGWVDYGGKHYESVYTRFYQAYVLPRKFGADKRRAHLSTLVCAGQITRADALANIAKEICAPELLRQDLEFVTKKLGITRAEFDEMMAAPRRSMQDYPSYESGRLFRTLQWCYRLPRRLRRPGSR